MLSSSGYRLYKKRSYDDKFIFVFLLKGRDITCLLPQIKKKSYYMHRLNTFFFWLNYLFKYDLNESIMLL